jgi:hypothetical protein
MPSKKNNTYFEYNLDIASLKFFLFYLRKMLFVKIYEINLKIRYYKLHLKTRNLKQKYSGPILCIANGPSLSSTLDRASKELNLDFSQIPVFACNEYWMHQNLIGLKPQFYTLFDPDYFHTSTVNLEYVKNNSDFGEQNNVGELLKSWASTSNEVLDSDMTVFVNISHTKNIQNNTRHNIYPILGLTSPIVNNVKDITRTLKIPSLTVYMNICIAAYMGFSPIYIAGYDNSSTLTLRRLENGDLTYRFEHFYPETKNETSRISTMETHEFFSSASQIHRLHMNLKNLNVINLDRTGITGLQHGI